MPDAIEKLRTAAEADLESVLRKLNASARRQLRGALRQYGSIQAIPPEVWARLKNEQDAEVAAVLLLVMMQSYETEQRQLGEPVDATTLERAKVQAAPVAAAMGRDTVNRYLDAAKDRMGRKEAAQRQQTAVAEPIPMKDREAIIRDALDDDALEPAVSTPTTRGITIGQVSAGNDTARRRGLAVDYKWRTERDSKVCPICRPLDGLPSSKWEQALAGTQAQATVQQVLSGPPGHPNCRCRLELYFPGNVNLRN